MSRIVDHPVLGKLEDADEIWIIVDGKKIPAREGETVLSALLANGVYFQNVSEKKKAARGLFCGIGRCTGCVMTVDGIPNTRTCVTPVREGMVVNTQHGLGKWGEGAC
jgi:predicted molibdopterin-dependent oxidoreductase YjgC